MFEEDPGEAGRDRGHDEQPAQPGVRRGDPPGSQGVEHGAHDACPGRPVEDDQRQGRRHVEADEERQEVRLGGRLGGHHIGPAEQLRHDDRVAKARDREELGHALQDAEHDRLQVRQHGVTSGARRRARSRPRPASTGVRVGKDRPQRVRAALRIGNVVPQAPITALTPRHSLERALSSGGGRMVGAARRVREGLVGARAELHRVAQPRPPTMDERRVRQPRGLKPFPTADAHEKRWIPARRRQKVPSPGARWVMPSGPPLRQPVRVTDDELVLAITSGDRDAFATLVEREALMVYRVCYRVLGTVSDAEDAAQETFVQAYRALATFRGEGSRTGWLRRIATRQALRQAGRRVRPCSWIQRLPARLPRPARLRCHRPRST